MNTEAPWALNFIYRLPGLCWPLTLSETLVFPDPTKVASSRRMHFWWEETIMRKPNGVIYAVRCRACSRCAGTHHLSHWPTSVPVGKAFFDFQASLRAKSLKNACFVGAWEERRGKEVDLVTQPIWCLTKCRWTRHGSRLWAMEIEIVPLGEQSHLGNKS